MNGHATAQEIEAVRALEESMRATLDSEGLLDLAQLYFEPMHQESTAAGICELVLALYPDNSRARIWIAYAALHHEMTETALRRASTMLRDISGDPSLEGIALMLLAEILDDLDEGDSSERLALLERSVELAPSMVTNRRRLARAYASLGRREDARHELEIAISHVIRDPRKLHPVEASFHTCLTGRIERVEELAAERARI